MNRMLRLRLQQWLRKLLFLDAEIDAIDERLARLKNEVGRLSREQCSLRNSVDANTSDQEVLSRCYSKLQKKVKKLKRVRDVRDALDAITVRRQV